MSQSAFPQREPLVLLEAALLDRPAAASVVVKSFRRCAWSAGSSAALVVLAAQCLWRSSYACIIRTRFLTTIVASGLAVQPFAVTAPEPHRSTASVDRSIAGGKSRIGGIERFPFG